MFKVQTLNNIATIGLSRLMSRHYEIGSDVTDPDAILVRSATMHGREIAPSLKAVGRAGAVNAALLNLTMDATAELAAVQAGQMLGGNYMRANVPLDQPFALDDYANVGELVRATQHYIEHSADWQTVRAWVGNNWK